MQSSAQALRLVLEQVKHMLRWDVGEHHVGLLANNARLSFHQWFVDGMEVSGDWGPIWLQSWLALASWPGTVCVCVCFLSPLAWGEWWDLLPKRGSLSWASLNMVVSFFAMVLPFHSFEHPFSRRWPLDHLRSACGNGFFFATCRFDLSMEIIRLEPPSGWDADWCWFPFSQYWHRSCHPCSLWRSDKCPGSQAVSARADPACHTGNRTHDG